MAAVLLVAMGAPGASAETLDRVVASVGNLAITASEVAQEYRFERFLDGQWPPPPPSAATLASAREHLTYQVLLTREENPAPEDKAASEKSAAARMAALHGEYSHGRDFQKALGELGMTEAQLLARIAQQDLMLRLIDERLRPAASPSEDAVADYYRQTFVPEFQKKNPGVMAPPLSDVEVGIREVLLQKRINELLNQWIEELKPTTNVRFHEF